jgi:hypothetical protein
MTYIVKVYKWSDCKKILKGFDGKKPVFISQGEFNKGKTGVQEFASQTTAMQAIEKIKAYEPWRHYEIVGLV